MEKCTLLGVQLWMAAMFGSLRRSRYLVVTRISGYRAATAASWASLVSARATTFTPGSRMRVST